MREIVEANQDVGRPVDSQLAGSWAAERKSERFKSFDAPQPPPATTAADEEDSKRQVDRVTGAGPLGRITCSHNSSRLRLI